MADFYAARSGTIPPLPWSNFAPPLSRISLDVEDLTFAVLDHDQTAISRDYTLNLGTWTDRAISSRFLFAFLNLVFKDKISATRIVGIAAVVVGLVLFVGASKVNASGTLFGDLLFAGSGIMFAAYAVLVRTWSLDTMTATIAVVLLSCLPIPLLYTLGPTGLRASSVAEIAVQLVIQGFLAGAAAIVLYTYMVRQLGPLTAVMPCIPITTAIVGVIVLNEGLTRFQFVAIGIIALGTVVRILQRGIRKRQTPAPN